MTRTPSSPDFDPRISDWLEHDPDHAPGTVLATVLAALPSIPQRRASRVPWRLPTMFPLRLAGAAAVLGVLVIGGVVLLARPAAITPSTAATPSPSSPAPTVAPTAAHLLDVTLTRTFTSTRHGYSVGYPAGWTTVPATEPWTTTSPDLTSPFMDRLSGAGAKLVVVSAPLRGKTPDEWKAAYSAQYGGDGFGVCDVLPANWPTIEIGGRTGWLDGDACPGDRTVTPSDRFYEAVTFVDGRVYLFWIQGDVLLPDFQLFLDSVRFDAAAASDAIATPGGGPRTP